MTRTWCFPFFHKFPKWSEPRTVQAIVRGVYDPANSSGIPVTFLEQDRTCERCGIFQKRKIRL